MLIHLVLLLFLLIVCSFCPGYFFVQRVAWNPLEKLCASIGLSLFLVYCATFAVYWANIDMRWCWAVTGLSAIAGLTKLKSLRLFPLARQLRAAAAGFGLLWCWSLLLLAIIRHYSGGGWIGDWVEHFHRTMFFLRHLPVETLMFPDYHVAARPPMQNVLSAFFLAQTAFRFDFQQLIFVSFSLLIFFPACLFAQLFAKRGRSLVTIATFLALNPMFVQNATYPWTKLFAAFYILAGMCFYLAGLRKNDQFRIGVAFASLSIGVLVHYSAAPYLFLVTVHYIALAAWKLSKTWKTVAATACICSIILATWFGWAVAAYGPKTTFLSNTTVTASLKGSEPTALRVLLNIRDTLVPHFLRTNAELYLFKQRSETGYIRDYLFTLYQTNALFMAGAAGGLVGIWLLGRRLWSGIPPGSARIQKGFWLLIIFGSLTIGVAVIGERDTFGVGHITLQAVVVLLLTFIGANFRSLGKVTRWLLIAGCVIDFTIGILLQIKLESLDFNPDDPSKGIFRQVQVERSGELLNSVQTDLSPAARTNLLEKYGLATPVFGYPPPRHLEFLGDRFGAFSSFLQITMVLGGAAMLIYLVRVPPKYLCKPGVSPSNGKHK